MAEAFLKMAWFYWKKEDKSNGTPCQKRPGTLGIKQELGPAPIIYTVY